MANNRFQVRRSSVPGKIPTTSELNIGEIGLNLTDQIMYSTNGTVVFEIGANTTNSQVSNTLTVRAISANGANGSSGQVLTTNGTATYWSTVSGSGTVTQVNTGNGMTGGPVTTTGTVSVLANTGIVANSTGLFVNSTYIGTLTANNTSFVGSVSAANIVSNAQLSSNLANYQTTAGLSANVATLTANNTNFVGTVSAANVVSNSQLSSNLGNYQTTAGLSANVATLTANNANFVKANNGIISNSFGVFVNANNGLSVNSVGVHAVAGNGLAASNSTGLHVGAGNGITVNSTATAVLANTGIVANATGTFVNATYISTISSNNASFLGGVAAASYVQNTDSRTLSGNLTFSGANVNFTGNARITGGLIANGSLGTANNVLTSNGSSVYWAAASGGSSNAVYVKGGAASIGSLAEGGSNLFRVNANTLNYNTTFVAGENGSATGPITVASGITLTVETGARVAIL